LFGNGIDRLPPLPEIGELLDERFQRVEAADVDVLEALDDAREVDAHIRQAQERLEGVAVSADALVDLLDTRWGRVLVRCTVRVRVVEDVGAESVDQLSGRVAERDVSVDGGEFCGDT
jgi:hypothetical protein